MNAYSERLRWWVSLGIALFVMGGCTNDTTRQESTAELPLRLPHQELLTSSMRRLPVPGWTTSVEELGLPPGTVLRPVGNFGDEGILLGITGDGWWLVGLDVATGIRSLGPVRLGSDSRATGFKCYLNGPPLVLCLREEGDPDIAATAWVVDTSSGQVTSNGPTDLRISGSRDQPHVEQIGQRAVAAIDDKGMFGIGARGELTWFVPGNGILPAQFGTEQRDTDPPRLAIQGGKGLGDVVLSVVDGAVIQPEHPPGLQPGQAVVYPGGFAYQYTTTGYPTRDRVAFFDEHGKKLAEPSADGALETRSTDLPVIGTDSRNLVLTLSGQTLLDLPSSAPSPSARLIGDRFFIADDADSREWRQYDLRTGTPGKTCEGDALGYQYIASDGEVAVALDGDTPARGVDLTTCETSWSAPGSTRGTAREVWKMHTTLVQRTGDELSSLIAPE